MILVGKKYFCYEIKSHTIIEDWMRVWFGILPKLFSGIKKPYLSKCCQSTENHHFT